MDDLLKPVRTVKKVQNNIERFESLTLRDGASSGKEDYRPKSSATKSKRSVIEIDAFNDEEPVIKISKVQPQSQPISVHAIKEDSRTNHRQHDSTVFLERSYLKESSPPSLSDNAREILRSQPCHEDLKAVLGYLQYGIDGKHDFDIRVTSPKAAQIINVLVTNTIPDVWANIKQRELSEDEAQMKKAIVASLSCVAGIGSLLGQIKALSSTQKNEAVVSDLIMVLGNVLRGPKTVLSFLRDAHKLYEKEALRRLYWQEMTTLLGGSRVLSITAQAFGPFRTDSVLHSYSWLADGAQYTEWLAKNITTAARQINASEEDLWIFLSHLLKRGLGLGHRETFVSEIYSKLLLGQRAFWTPVHLLLKHLAPHDQKSFFDSVLSDLARNYLASAGGPAIAYSHDPKMQKIVAGAAALVAGLVQNNDVLESHVEEWLVGGQNSAVVIGLTSRRALIAALGRSEEKLQRVLEKSLSNFGNKLQINHVSIVQQEATAQTILLAVGALNRIDIRILRFQSISTSLMHAVSNRLAASIPRTRLLGMIVGTAVSRIVDKPESVIDFEVEEMDSEDTKMWLNLPGLNDHAGDISDIRLTLPDITKPMIVASQRLHTAKPVARQPTLMSSKIIAIEEVSSSSDSQDDDLMPYQKPDSDPEDSEDDATLINRDKPSAPVYIVDLIRRLQTNEKPDVLSLALRTASLLIRRKANFGTELSDNIFALVTTLVNLQEGMSEPVNQQLRLESIIACLVARPELVASSLADLYYQGDFSLSQRICILTAIGLASRELAGFKDDQAAQLADTFPSKRLPPHLEPSPEAQTSAISNPIAMLTDTSAHETIRPMALAAADKMTGPSILKIRTFSSRMEVEKKQKQKQAARTKVIPKNLYRLLTDSIYLPLCSRMSLLLSHTIGGRLANTTILHGSTMRLFLQTLTLVLHTLGPSAATHLPTLTQETLLLLTSLHEVSHLSTDPAILPAILYLLLALLDLTIEAGLTAQERLMADHGTQMAELIGWSNGLADKTGVPSTDGDQGSLPWTVLAAGIQVKWFEMGRKFQGRMLGLSLDEMDQLTSN